MFHLGGFLFIDFDVGMLPTKVPTIAPKSINHCPYPVLGRPPPSDKLPWIAKMLN